MKRTGKSISCWGDVINKWKAPVVFLRHSELGGWEIQVCVSGDDRVGPHSEVAQMGRPRAEQSRAEQALRKRQRGNDIA